MRLETERLILRPWEDRDREAYAAILADPEVRRYFPSVVSRADADIAIDRAAQILQHAGFGFLAAERKSDGVLLGMLGMAPFQPPFRRVVRRCPPVEIGWQLGRPFWGQGYAPEGALAMLQHGFLTLGLTEIGAVTYSGNLPSRRVMEKIGMVHDESADFRNPNVPPGSWLKPHVLYRIGRRR